MPMESTTTLQLGEPVAADRRTHGIHHQVGFRFCQQRWHGRQLHEKQLASG